MSSSRFFVSPCRCSIIRSADVSLTPQDSLTQGAEGFIRCAGSTVTRELVPSSHGVDIWCCLHLVALMQNRGRQVEIRIVAFWFLCGCTGSEWEFPFSLPHNSQITQQSRGTAGWPGDTWWQMGKVRQGEDIGVAVTERKWDLGET